LRVTSLKLLKFFIVIRSIIGLTYMSLPPGRPACKERV